MEVSIKGRKYVDDIPLVIVIYQALSNKIEFTKLFATKDLENPNNFLTLNSHITRKNIFLSLK